MQIKIREYISKNVDLFSLICIFITCLLFFSPYIFTNPAPLIYPVSELGTDLDRDVLPNIEFIINTIKINGEIPLWRPFLLSGAPLIGHPSLPIFYPLYWIFLVIPIPLGLNLIAFLNIFWMGAGTYLYLKYVGNNRTLTALAGAIAMAISPKWIAHLSGGHWSMLTALSWAPWAFLSLEHYWKKRSLIWIVLLSISLASMGINFLPFFIIISITLVFINFTYFSRKFLFFNFKRMLLGWIPVVLLVFGLTSAQILPMIELLPYTVHTTSNTTFTSLHPLGLLTAIFPPDLKYPEWFLYLGIPVLLFAVIGCLNNRSKFENLWCMLGLTGLVLSLGEFTPIYKLLFGWNPLISVLRVPTRWWFLTIFASIILFAKGLDYWVDNKYQLNSRTKVVVALLIFVQIFAGGVKLLLGNLFPFSTLSTAIVAILIGIIIFMSNFQFKPLFVFLVFLILIIDLSIVNYSLIKPRNAEITEVPTKFAIQIDSKLNDGERSFSPGSGMPALFIVRSNIHVAEGYDALPLENYLKFIRIATGCPLVQEATGSQEEIEECLNPNQIRINWLKLLNVRYLISEYESEWKIRELSSGFGRAFSVNETKKTTDDNCLANLMAVDVSNVALVEGEIFDQQSGRLRIIDQERGVNNETFQVFVENDTTLLIRSESWAPGWKARVDGQLVEVNRINCVIQGVWLEEGDHTVEFYYQPLGYPIGFWISTVTFTGIVFISLVLTLKKKKH